MILMRPVSKTCKYCGSILSEKEKVCPNCGQRLQEKGGLTAPAAAAAALLLFFVLLFFVVLPGKAGGGRKADDLSAAGTAGGGESSADRNSAREDASPPSGGSAGEDAPAGGNASGTEPQAPAQTVFHTGETLTDGDLRITFISSGGYVEENEYLQPEEGNRYIFLKFAFENTSRDRNRSVSFSSFRCYADGYAARSHYGTGDELSAALSPGRSTTASLYFSVPQDARDIDIEYEMNYGAGQKVHFLYEGEQDSGYTPAPVLTGTEGAVRPGESTEAYNMRILYASCEKDESGSDFFYPEAGCSYYTLSFEFENLQSAEREVSRYDFHCYADGAACRSTWHRDDAVSAVIAGGRKAGGTVTFDVPDAAQTVEVVYDVNYWINQRIVFTVR